MDVRMGDQDAVEALPGAGRLEGRVARRFGGSRRTIHAWIESGQLDRDLSSGASRYSPWPRVAQKLDPYKELIEVRLGEFPKLSAKRLFDEVRAAGYDGGYNRVRDYVREVRPRAPQEVPVRFETSAGHQGQVDFGTFRLPWGRRHALLVVLGYSRLLWLRFYTRQTMPVLIEGLESAFCRFGGVPRELLFDQKCAVVVSDARTSGGELALMPSSAVRGPLGVSCRGRAVLTGRRTRAKWSGRPG